MPVASKKRASLQCKVDTGAGGNVMPLGAFAKLFPNRLTKTGMPTDTLPRAKPPGQICPPPRWPLLHWTVRILQECILVFRLRIPDRTSILYSSCFSTNRTLFNSLAVASIFSAKSSVVTIAYERKSIQKYRLCHKKQHKKCDNNFLCK